MASCNNAGDNGATDAAIDISNAFQVIAQQLPQLQESVRLQQQELNRRVLEVLAMEQWKVARQVQEILGVQKRVVERSVQEALNLQQRHVEQQVQEVVRLQQQVERQVQEALRLQEQRAVTEMERKLRVKDCAIRALQQRLRETQRRTAVDEPTAILEGLFRGEVDWELIDLEMMDDNSPQSEMRPLEPHAEALLRQPGDPDFARPSHATAASSSAPSARAASETGGAAASGGEEPPPPEALPAPSPSTNPTASRDDHQDAADDEVEREKQRVELRVREVKRRRQETLNSRSLLGEKLCIAAYQGRLTDIQRLICAGANINYTDKFGHTPLFKAMFLLTHADVVSLLLECGADVNTVDLGGCSVLHWVTTRVRTQWCVDLLVNAGAEVDARSENGETPLHWAASRDYEEAVRALLAAGARRDLKPWGGPWKDKTPFNIAASPVVRHLLRL